MRLDNYNIKATRSVTPNIIPPTASGKLYPTAAPTLLFVVEVELEPALEPVFVGAAPPAVVAGLVPCEVCAAPIVETPGGTVPPGQFVGGGALFACTTCKTRLSESRSRKQDAYSGRVLAGRVRQTGRFTRAISTSESDGAGSTAPHEGIFVECPGWISTGVTCCNYGSAIIS